MRTARAATRENFWWCPLCLGLRQEISCGIHASVSSPKTHNHAASRGKRSRGRLWLLRLLAPDAPSILAVPAEERDKNTQAHDVEPHINVSTVESRCRGDRSR